MDKETKEKWVAALRSGDYKQGKSQLRREVVSGEPPHYCCLGVLCEIVEGVEWDGGRAIYGHTSHSLFLPSALKDELGIGDEDGPLMQMNDEGDSFVRIAQWIEYNL